MASRFLLNRYQRTLRPKTRLFLERAKMESKIASEMHDAKMNTITKTSSAIQKGGATLRDYKLAKAGGFEGGILNFLNSPEEAGTFKAKGADLARVYGKDKVLGGDIFIGETGGVEQKNPVDFSKIDNKDDIFQGANGAWQQRVPVDLNKITDEDVAPDKGKIYKQRPDALSIYIKKQLEKKLGLGRTR